MKVDKPGTNFSRQNSTPKKYFYPVVMIGALVLGVGLFVILLLILNWTRSPRPLVGAITAALSVIPVASNTPTPIILPTETSIDPGLPQNVPSDEFTVGAFVKVTGTGGAGLRLRSSPGLEAEPLFLGIEDEIFKIEAGPEEVDDYIWWYLVAPFESNRNGWAVSNYLEIVQEP